VQQYNIQLSQIGGHFPHVSTLFH